MAYRVEFLQEGVTVGQTFYSEAKMYRFIRTTDKTYYTVTEVEYNEA